jgi:hypothetical protein
MDALLTSPLGYIILALFGIAIILFLLALYQLRRARTASYWRMRRDAGQRGGQLFLISVALAGLALALAFFSGLASLALGDRFPEEAAQADVEATVAQAISATLAALPSPTGPALTDPPPEEPTATPETPDPPTATATVTSTATPTIPPPTEPPPVSIPAPFAGLFRLGTPVAVQATPRAGAEMQLTAVTAGITAQGGPDNAAATFEAGTDRLYFFFAYAGLDDGVLWSRVLLHNGVPVYGRNARWSLGESGESFFFIGLEEGFPPGNYELRLILGSDEISRLAFTVSPES